MVSFQFNSLKKIYMLSIIMNSFGLSELNFSIIEHFTGIKRWLLFPSVIELGTSCVLFPVKIATYEHFTHKNNLEFVLLKSPNC